LKYIICHSEFISESNNFNNLATLEIPKPARLTVFQAGKFGMTIVTPSVCFAGQRLIFLDDKKLPVKGNEIVGQ